jgi:hypothetical protein
VCGQLAILPGTVPPPQPTAKLGSGRLDIAFTGRATGTVTTPGAVTRVPLPTVRVAFGTDPMNPVPTWTDITAYSRMPLVVTHGRPDEFSDVQPGTLSGELKNFDGRFTMGKTSGPYGTGVKIGRRVKVTLAHQGIHYDRFDGHANGWPTTWPTGRTSVAFGELSATDRLKRLGQVGELRSMLEEETLRDAPACYYPLSEPDGATSAGSVTRTPQASAGDWPAGTGGGAINFGQGTGPGTDGLSAAMFEPQSQTSGRMLRANPVLVNANTSDACTLSVWFATATNPTPNDMAMAALTTSAGDDALILAVWPGGKVEVAYHDAGARVFSNLSPKVYTDGHTHHAAATATRAPTGVVTVRLYVDGVLVQTGTFGRGPLGAFTQVDIGGFHMGGDYAPYAGTLSHVSAYPTALSAARITTHWQAGSTGLAGERTDQRIARVADWIGLPAGDRALDVGDKTMGPQSTATKQPLDVMREAAAVEQGVLFIAPNGKLTFHRLSRRYNRTTPDLTLDCALGHIQVGLVLPGDDFGVVNDLRVSRPGGAEQRAFNDTSINSYGLYRDSLEIPAASDNEAQAVANWRVGNYGEPRPRIPNLTVSLARLHKTNPSLVAAIMRLQISSLVRLTNLPTQAPGTSVDVFVEGWTETIDPAGGWAIELNCSPADHYTVAQLGLTATVTLGTMRVGL